MMINNGEAVEKTFNGFSVTLSFKIKTGCLLKDMPYIQKKIYGHHSAIILSSVLQKVRWHGHNGPLWL